MTPVPDEPQVLGEGRWQMWALPWPDRFYEPGDRRYTIQYADRRKGEEPVPVVVEEDPDGRYWGWIWDGKDVPDMIHAERGLFRMCFPYGPETEAERGKGRIVRLRISALES